jgi:hypothetical protein
VADRMNVEQAASDRTRKQQSSASPTAPQPLASRTQHPLLALQKQIGNRAVTQWLQAQLKVGAVDDKYEHEAELVAKYVMHMSAPPHCKCSGHDGAGGECPTCKQKRLMAQRKMAGMNTSPYAPPVVHSVLSTAGRPLDRTTRAFMETRFGRDLSHVRVHTDSQAASSSREISARAYTVGHNIVFGANEYKPESLSGKKLLAHELTHVIQQGALPNAESIEQQILGSGIGLPRISLLLQREPIIQRELVYASGYPRRYRNDQVEVRCVESPRCEWFPASIDFRATATNSGGGTGQGTFTGLIAHIASRSPDSIEELGLIGHANRDFFGLSGRISESDVFFTAPGLIGMDSINANMAAIERVRDRFATGARIILYGCHAGLGSALLDAISRAFRVCVQGFSQEILTCIEWRTPDRTITSRGKVMVDSAGLVAAGQLQCAQFHTNVRSLTPDQESCVGVPQEEAQTEEAPQTAPEAARDLRWSASASVGAGFLPDLRAMAGLTGRVSLRTGPVIVFNPIIGLNILYGPSSGTTSEHLFAAVADVGLRIQQPIKGAYLDVLGSGFVGFTAERGAGSQATAGLGAALGAGWRWQRAEVGAEVRSLFPLTADDPNVLLVVGRGAIRF